MSKDSNIFNKIASFEELISTVWSNSMFTLFGYGFVFLYNFIKIVIRKTYISICYLINLLRHKPSSAYDTGNLYSTGFYMLIFFGLGLIKLGYYSIIILWWFIRNILVPIIIWATFFFSILFISGKRSSHTN